MKRALLLIAVPALLVALGFAQTPATSIKTDPTIVKGCLGGSDGNYTVAEDNTGRIFKLTTSSVDLKAHVGHEVKLVGNKASGASDSLAVTEVNMISEHCGAAAVAPAATVSTTTDTAVAPAAAAAPAAATVTTTSETAAAPAPAAAAPAATVSTTSETAAVPAAAAAAPAATVTTTSETVSTPAAATTHRTRPPARPRKLPATPAAAATAPAAAATSPVAADATPAAAASTSAETVNTPAAATPTAPAKHGSLFLLLGFGALVILLGIMAPTINRWRKRRILEQTGPQNLSFNKTKAEQSEDERPRKAA